MCYLNLVFKDEKMEALKWLRNFSEITHLGDGGARLPTSKNTFRASKTGNNIILPPIKQGTA